MSSENNTLENMNRRILLRSHGGTNRSNDNNNNPSVHELAAKTNRYQQIDNTAGGWRDGTNRGYNEDDVFKAVHNTEKQRRQSQVQAQAKQAADAEDISIPDSLQPIMRDEAAKMNLSASEWQRQNIIRTQQRQQYLSSRRLS